MLMNDTESKTVSDSKESTDNDDEPDLQQVLLYEARLRQKIRMRINKLKNERRQNINHERKFSISKMIHDLQKERKHMVKQNKRMYFNVEH